MDYIVILCAGSGFRASLGDNKIFYPIADGTVLSKTLQCFNGFGNIILTVAAKDINRIKKLNFNATIIEGGNTRTQSVRNALNHIATLSGCDKDSTVAIHDCARPFASHTLIQQAIQSAKKNGSGIPVIKAVDTIVKTQNGLIIDHLKKEELFIVQTPQCFNYLQIKHAYDKVEGDYADDSIVYKMAGYSPTPTNGDYANKKLTVKQDFINLNPCVAAAAMDFHQLVDGRKLVLGGITVPNKKGLLGHSDADVVTHAIIDSVLQAAGKPDIGVMFPDTDPSYKDIDSFILLDKAMQYLKENGRQIVSASCVIMAQKPKLAPFIPLIRKNLAKKLNIGMNFMMIHATTTEFLGTIGKGKGIASNAMILYKQTAPLKITDDSI